MKFAGQGRPITRAGLSKALAMLGLGPNDAAYIWTVVEVETAGIIQGFGFRVDRRPQILFERHMFRRYTDGRFDSEAPDISGPACFRNNTLNWKEHWRFAPRQNSAPSPRFNRRHGEWGK